VVTWYDHAATVAGGAGLSGLDFMHALMDGKIPPPPIALLLNMRPAKVDRGLVVSNAPWMTRSVRRPRAGEDTGH